MQMYHGTIEKNVESIFQNGLREGSYVTPFLYSALSYGGPHLFVIDFPEVTKLDSDNWEYVTPRTYHKEDIIAYLEFSVELKYHNVEAELQAKRKRVSREGHVMCEACRGDGQTNYPHDGHHFIPGGGRWDSATSAPIVCEKCGGHGVENFSYE